jgi:hypothetical protein
MASARKKSTYWDTVTDAASIDSWNRTEEPDIPADTEDLVSIESNAGIIDLRSFAKEYPEKLFPLLKNLRPEFQELCIEYYVLDKPQKFLAQTHGEVQTRVWQQLLIIGRAIGALIVLGEHPSAAELHEILASEGVEQTEVGLLSDMIATYDQTRSYAEVAKKVNVPIPVIRKIFRPAIPVLLKSKNLKAAAVGAYLHNLTYQVSLTKAGLSQSSKARLKRVSRFKFDAPAADSAPLISAGKTEKLTAIPWQMLELSSDAQLSRVLELVRKNIRRIAGKQPVQIFAPIKDGVLEFGYLLVRSTSHAAIRQLLRIRGIAELVIRYENDLPGDPVEIPAADIEPRINQLDSKKRPKIPVGAFVRILTGPASGYCGKVTRKNWATVKLPTKRQFQIKLAAGSAEILALPVGQQTFCGQAI